MNACDHGADKGSSDDESFIIHCVDDEPNILTALRRLFRPAGYRVLVANSGAEGLQMLEREPVDLVISDMRMPEMDGARFLALVRERWPEVIRILLTGYADIASTIEAINKGQIYRYIAKPWDGADMLPAVKQALERKQLEREKARLEALTRRQNEELVGLTAELKTLNASLEQKVKDRTAELEQVNSFLNLTNDKLKQNFLTSIKMFSNLIEIREDNVAGHSRRVADLGRRLARRLGLEGKAAQDVFVAGLLHDVGKIGFRDVMLAKPVSQLSADELGRYRKHPLNGEAALMPLEELRDAARIVRSHHERFDGQGFPDALSGIAIPIGARILSVVNDYDGLQIGILGAKRMEAEEAKALIQKSRGHRYDPQVVDAFIEMLGGSDKDRAKEIALGAADIKPGMVLSRDLISRDGVLLLAADYVLDSNLVRQIQDFARKEGVGVAVHVRADRR